MTAKELAGFFSVGFLAVSEIPYIYSIIVGKTKPHIFTHLLWGLMALVSGLALHLSNAGAGAWAAIGFSVFSTIIVVLSLSHGERTITRGDWVALIIGLCGIPLWIITQQPFLAILLATLVDLTGYYPTIRKSYLKPYEEAIFPYAMANTKQLMTLLAMTELSLTTLFYPTTLFIADTLLISMLVWRRHALRATR